MNKNVCKVTLMSVLMVVLMGSLSACKGDKDEPSKPFEKSLKEVTDLDATARNKWVYFSLAKGDIVQIANPEESLDWDFAMRRELIRVNGSQHYRGKAAVALTDKTSIEDVTDSKGLIFLGNTMHKVQVVFDMSDESKNKYEDQYHVLAMGEVPHKQQPNKTQEGNTIVSYNILMYKMMEGAAAMYPAQPYVFIFKCADGKREYKLQFNRAVNAEGKNGGTLSFRFAQIK